MKVLYLINYAGKAGTEKYVENLVRILGAEGVECHLGYNVAGELSEKLISAGVPTLRLKMGHGKTLFAAAKKLTEYCLKNSIDVIHAQYPVENLTAVLAKRRIPSLRVVYTSHLTITQGPVWRTLNRFCSKYDHKAIAVCGQGAELLLQNGFSREKVAVVYNGVEPAPPPPRQDIIREAHGLPADCFVMAILARYAPEKGLDFLLDALTLTAERTERPFVCFIAGDGELFSHIAERSGTPPLNGHVIQGGYRTDTAAILASSDIYLNSSLANEAMSFAILEAMGAGLPLVVTDVGGNRDLAETGTRCGFVVAPGDTEGFASACLRLMEDDGLRREYSALASEKARRDFDLNKLAHDVYGIYTEGAIS